MLASDLIKSLQELIGEHGDTHILFDDGAGAMYYLSSPEYNAGEIIIYHEE